MSKCNMKSCDCYKENTTACWFCTRCEQYGQGELSDKYVSELDRVIEIYEYLAGGDMPGGVTCWQPKMSRKHAFDVIWFLQEVTHCLPDHIEKCKGCDNLFDTDCEGCFLDDQYELRGKTLPKKYWGHWCVNCIPRVGWSLR